MGLGFGLRLGFGFGFWLRPARLRERWHSLRRRPSAAHQTRARWPPPAESRVGTWLCRGESKVMGHHVTPRGTRLLCLRPYLQRAERDNGSTVVSAAATAVDESTGEGAASQQLGLRHASRRGDGDEVAAGSTLLLRRRHAHPSRRQGEAEGGVVCLEGGEAVAIGVDAWPRAVGQQGRRPAGGGGEQERRSAAADELAPSERSRRCARKRLAVVRCWRLCRHVKRHRRREGEHRRGEQHARPAPFWLPPVVRPCTCTCACACTCACTCTRGACLSSFKFCFQL